MRPHVTRAALNAITERRLRPDSDGPELPEAFYPPGWLARAEDLASGRAAPQDWWDGEPDVRRSA